jgi:hypothetical protein
MIEQGCCVGSLITSLRIDVIFRGDDGKTQISNHPIQTVKMVAEINEKKKKLMSFYSTKWKKNCL